MKQSFKRDLRTIQGGPTSTLFLRLGFIKETFLLIGKYFLWLYFQIICLHFFIINVLKKPIFKTIRNAAFLKPYNNLSR